MSTSTVCQSLAWVGFDVFCGTSGAELRAPVTAREMEVLRLLADGLTNPQISRRLFISLSTVNHHVHNILEKLGAKTRTEAVAIAVRDGLVHL